MLIGGWWLRDEVIDVREPETVLNCLYSGMKGIIAIGLQLGMWVCHMTSRVRSDLIGQLTVICSQMTVLK